MGTLLGAGRSVALDNTNPSRAERALAIAAARDHGAEVVGYWFPPDVAACIARNAARAGKERVPLVGIFATRKRLEAPTPGEGFDRLYEVRPLPGARFEVVRLAPAPGP